MASAAATGAKRKSNPGLTIQVSNGAAANKRNKTSGGKGTTALAPPNSAASASAVASDSDDDSSPDSPPAKGGKRSRRSRVSKGLRHFSVKVCEKLEHCSVTTYNEIANLLVKDFMDENKEGLFDEKNIRRRIYDALNVLMAMDIIQKEKKEIRWVGVAGILEQEADPTPELQKQKAEILKSLESKKQQLEEMTLQFIALRNLMDRNSRPEARTTHKDKLHLPFIIVKTKPSTDITCEMNESRERVNFIYSDQFEIHDDQVVLKKIILQESSKSDVRAYIPAELQPYLPSLFPTHPKSINKLSNVTAPPVRRPVPSSHPSLYSLDAGGYTVTSLLPSSTGSSPLGSPGHTPGAVADHSDAGSYLAGADSSPAAASGSTPLHASSIKHETSTPTAANPDAAAAAALTALFRAPSTQSASAASSAASSSSHSGLTITVSTSAQTAARRAAAAAAAAPAAPSAASSTSALGGAVRLRAADL